MRTFSAYILAATALASLVTASPAGRGKCGLQPSPPSSETSLVCTVTTTATGTDSGTSTVTSTPELIVTVTTTEIATEIVATSTLPQSTETVLSTTITVPVRIVTVTSATATITTVTSTSTSTTTSTVRTVASFVPIWSAFPGAHFDKRTVGADVPVACTSTTTTTVTSLVQLATTTVEAPISTSTTTTTETVTMSSTTLVNQTPATTTQVVMVPVGETTITTTVLTTDTVTTTAYTTTTATAKFYAGCQPDNFLGSFFGSDIARVSSRADNFATSYPAATTREDCCGACIDDPTCQLSAFTLDPPSCLLLRTIDGSTFCEPAAEKGFFYVGMAATVKYVISNGQCGQWSYFD